MKLYLPIAISFCICALPSCVPSKKVCEPLEQRECYCSDGVPGVQHCVSTGDWWTLCDCECRPDCGSRQCGDDGCGGSCGECYNQCTKQTDPSLCVDGYCQRACCPHTCEMIGRGCGDWHDGCGGILDCGGCPEGQACVNGTCLDEDIMCVAESDCPWGFRCEEWFCIHEGLYPAACSESHECPPDSYCEDGCCFPCDEGIQGENCMAPSQDCVVDGDCHSGFSCIYGSCWPQNDPEAVIPVFFGDWDSKYYFDMSEAIRGLATIEAVDSLNRYFNSCEHTGIGWLDDMLCERKPEYTADYTHSLIDIFANLQNILSELRAEGISSSINLCPQEVVSAIEDWTSLRFVYLNACCDCGRDPDSGCNPYEQQDFPECAYIDIAMEELEQRSAVVEVDPFTGKIDIETGGGSTVATFATDSRRVRIEYTHLVSFLVDRLVQQCTGQDSLDEALINSTDCQVMQDILDEISGGWAPNIIQTCENHKPYAGSLLRGIQDQIGVGFKLLDFTGFATVAANGDPATATSLGNPDFEQTNDGRIEGDCAIVLHGDVTGAWHWER